MITIRCIQDSKLGPTYQMLVVTVLVRDGRGGAAQALVTQGQEEPPF